MRGQPMKVTTSASREFNQDTGRAKRASKNGPVIITDRGKPAHVLLSIQAYREMMHKPRSLAHALAMPNAAQAEFEPPVLGRAPLRPGDFS